MIKHGFIFSQYHDTPLDKEKERELLRDFGVDNIYVVYCVKNLNFFLQRVKPGDLVCVVTFLGSYVGMEQIVDFLSVLQRKSVQFVFLGQPELPENILQSCDWLIQQKKLIYSQSRGEHAQ